MNFSCLYFYPRHNLDRKACSSHFEGFQIGQSPIFVELTEFVSFLGRLCKLSDIFGGVQCELF